LYELIYAGREVEDLIKKRYPEAKIRDASDEIHTERFECEVEADEEEFYIWAILEGYANTSLAFELMSRDCPEGTRQKVWDYIAEAKAIDESEDLKYSKSK